ncbi:hypothetical protein Hypma_013422 [Hypsizygus marmoreus]|uniref:Uncharacterized protein n=1 Tax=Hypsizygus marmoreus TaxID=39966 RepID=A0A369JBW3_HYPMA|nr:hypothetical protein Hypma_013422 [Hypsizygus marmoreus]
MSNSAGVESKADLIRFVQSLEGSEIARIMSIASFSLADKVLLDWPMDNLTDPVLPESLPPAIHHDREKPFNRFCKPSIQSAFYLNLIAIGVIQGILVTRIWYLFQGSRAIQIGVILGFVASLVSSLVFLHLSANNLRIITSEDVLRLLPYISYVGCHAVRPPHFWRVYLPSLVLHSWQTVLYILTAMRALRNRRLLKNAPVLKRLLRDGGFFYFVVFVSVNLTAIGSLLKDVPKLNIPAIFSHFLLTTTSIAVSRVLFSIHSLADKLGSDSAWLLNNAQLTRLGFRRGAHEGELIIERNTVYSDDDLESTYANYLGKGHITPLKETRVGVYDDRPW